MRNDNNEVRTDNVARSGVSRISISLPEILLQQLDDMVRAKNYESRSQAIAEMIHHQLVEHRRQYGNTVMTGTITLVYDNTTPGLQRQLANLQYEYIDEVISSLHVNLMHAQTMEVILVQGPGQRLQLIADKMSTARGVISGKLQVTSAIIPPIHPFRAANEKDQAAVVASPAAPGQTQ